MSAKYFLEKCVSITSFRNDFLSMGGAEQGYLVPASECTDKKSVARTENEKKQEQIQKHSTFRGYLLFSVPKQEINELHLQLLPL